MLASQKSKMKNEVLFVCVTPSLAAYSMGCRILDVKEIKRNLGMSADVKKFLFKLLHFPEANATDNWFTSFV